MQEDRHLDDVPVEVDEDEARARIMAKHHGIDFDSPKPYRHPFLNGECYDA